MPRPDWPASLLEGASIEGVLLTKLVRRAVIIASAFSPKIHLVRKTISQHDLSRVFDHKEGPTCL